MNDQQKYFRKTHSPKGHQQLSDPETSEGRAKDKTCASGCWHDDRCCSHWRRDDFHTEARPCSRHGSRGNSSARTRRSSQDRAIQNAAQQLDLNLQNTNDVLAARAHVWAKNIAPMSYWDVPWSGPRNESVARSVAEMERTHPRTVGAAGQDDPDAKKRLEAAIAAGLATAGALQTFRITRSSKRNNCRRTVVISRSSSPLAAKHIEDAQASGQPRELTLDRPGTNQRRAANMRRSGLPPIPLYDRDEYPPAIFSESTNASVKYIPLSDNRSVGQQLKAQMNTPTRADDGCKVTITTGL